MAELVIIDPRGGETRLALQEREYLLGRDASATIPLRDPTVSRVHARVFRDGDTYCVEDLGSSNGVIINGLAISGPHRLVAGTLMEIGSFAVTFVADTERRPVGYHLLGTSAPCAGRSFPLHQGELAVGRAPGADIVLLDKSISREHALLRVTDKTVLLEDLDSSNGTYVNGERIRRKVLRPGQQLRFGTVELLFDKVAARPSPVAGLARHFDPSLRHALIIGVVSGLLLAVVLATVLRRAPPVDVKVRAGKPTVQEARHERATAEDLRRAREQMKQEAWAAAADAFRRVAERDPINPEARAGLAAAEANREDEKALRAAETALRSADPRRAVRALIDVREDSHYARQAEELRRKTESAIARQAMAEARGACRKEQWSDCHRRATEYLAHEPTATIGNALVREAENAMRARRISFVPWEMDEVARKARAALLIDYSDAEVREAALRYATGDLETALRRASTLRGRLGGARLFSLLTEIKQARAAAAEATHAGDQDAVVRELARARAADGRLLPENHVGVLRSELQEQLTQAYLVLGEAAFDRGSYDKAFSHWSAALRISPASQALQQAMDRLEERARAYLKGIPDTPTLAAEDCARLQVVLSMTGRHSEVRGEATAALSRCRRR